MQFTTIAATALSVLALVAPSMAACGSSLTRGSSCPTVGEGGCQTGGAYVLVCNKVGNGKQWQYSAVCDVGGGFVCECVNGNPACVKQN